LNTFRVAGSWRSVFIMDLPVMDLPVNLDSPESSFRAVENKIKWFEEFTHTMKVHRNTLVPISRLSAEILSIIFSLLPSFEVLDLESSPPTLLSPVSHVCHRWREISLNQPFLWNNINFTKLTPAGTSVMLDRAKTAPLYLGAQTVKWKRAKFKAFRKQIEAHIRDIRHLSITAKPKRLKSMLGRLISSAPFLELLSIDDRERSSSVIIPDNLFGGIAPKLTHLRLYNCGTRWKSPLFKGLRVLELFSFPQHARITFYYWLRALKQMPQLERLVLHDGIPTDLVPLGFLPQELEHTVDLPFLTELSISASVSECAVVLAHLVLPALTRLCINAQYDMSICGSMNHLIKCVARNAHGPQDTEALQSLFFGNNQNRAAFAAWTMPRQDSDDGLGSLIDLPDRTGRTRFELSIRGPCYRKYAMELQECNALLVALPLNSITSLTVKGRTPLSEGGWCTHASKWHKLERVRLFCAAVPTFQEMCEDAAVLGERLLPSLEELVLVNISLNAQKVYYLCDMLMECIELGIPLRTLDLRTCTMSNRAVQLLSEIVVDVLRPVKKESGDLNGRSQGSAGVLGEGEGGDEEDDKEPGFDYVPNFVGYWDSVDDNDNHFVIDDVARPYRDVGVGEEDEYDSDDDKDTLFYRENEEIE
jgi:hypothetical protein